MGIFEIDKQGLAKIARRRGLAFVLFELWQNAVDTRAKNIQVTLEKLPGRPVAQVVVEDDDPEGFKNLAHAYTLFAESEKIRDPEKRGRFNLGEKLIIAVCEEAEISSVTGTVIFQKGRRHRSSRKLEHGSRFSGTIRMNATEFSECVESFQKVIVPDGVRTTFNGEELPRRKPLRSFTVTLPTEVADSDGILRPTQRLTEVRVYSSPILSGYLYEMGIPVVETGDTWDVEIAQKVPLNTERDNVTPGYLRQVRVAVLNEMASFLEEEDAVSNWVREASSNPKCSDAAIKKIVALRFVNPVSFDPSDPEANRKATAEGYQVVAGGSLSKGEWENVRRSKAMLPAGQVTPSLPNKFVPAEYLSESELTKGMKRIRTFVREVSKETLGFEAASTFTKNTGVRDAASWGDRTVSFNVPNLGVRWFDDISAAVISLIIHEFAHEHCGNHLDGKYYHTLSDLGASFTLLALKNPKMFQF